MRITLTHDRLEHHPRHYRDPVVAKEGVFAHLAEEELSMQERERLVRAEARAVAKSQPQKQWLLTKIQERLTELYARFVKPKK